MNAPGDDDKQLDEYLRGDSEVSRRYRALAIDEPPAALDRAVLERAHAAVNPGAAKVTQIPRRRTTRWVVPFAIAATLLLSFAVFREAGIGTLPVGEEQPALPAEIQEKPAVSVETQVSAVPEAFAPPPSSAALKIEGFAKQDAMAEQKRSGGQLLNKTRAQAVEETGTAPVTEPPPQQLRRAESAASVEDAARDAAREKALRLTQPAPVAASAVSARGNFRQDTQEILVKGNRARVLKPEAWLKDIRELRKEGLHAEAHEELKRFMEAYPDYFDKHPRAVRP